MKVNQIYINLYVINFEESPYTFRTELNITQYFNYTEKKLT